MECDPQEHPILVLLLMVSFSEALQEMQEKVRVRPYFPPRRAPLDLENHWEVMVPCKSDLDLDLDLESRNGSHLNRQFGGSLEVEGDFWWTSGKKETKALSVGNCGAGSCGPSVLVNHS